MENNENTDVIQRYGSKLSYGSNDSAGSVGSHGAHKVSNRRWMSMSGNIVVNVKSGKTVLRPWVMTLNSYLCLSFSDNNHCIIYRRIYVNDIYSDNNVSR